jgi:hypothetical protein
MSSQNVLLHSKAIRLPVARLDITRLARRAGPLLVTADRRIDGRVIDGFMAASMSTGASGRWKTRWWPPSWPEGAPFSGASEIRKHNG